MERRISRESAEEDLGPFRDWPMEKQQAFIDQYGDISDELSLLQCPQQTEPQYWEIGVAAQDALRSRGYADDKIAALRTQYSYYDSGVEWGSNVWTVDFFPASNTDSDIVSDHLSVQVEVNGSEITASLWRSGADRRRHGDAPALLRDADRERYAAHHQSGDARDV